MLRFTEIIGFSVICLDTQKKEGEIKDFVLNSPNNKIEGFIMDCGNFIRRTKYLKYNDIYSIGDDIVSIKFKKNLIPEKKIKEEKELDKRSKYLFEREVITEKGDILGFVQDIIFEKSEGRILGIILTNGAIDDIISGVQILPLDSNFKYLKDKLIISEKTKVTITNNIGGLKKLLEL